MAEENLDKKLESIFEATVDLPTLDRPAAIAAACGGDAVLAARVAALHGFARDANQFMAAPTVSVPIDAPLAERVGELIGPYKLVEQIGEGGFGIVFMAMQEKPVRRNVALKVIKLGMDTREVVARFEAERQALALMDHPNIAKVLDAGATSTGRPYFVMELVRGSPITEYADKHRLNTRDRVALASQVCRAVQHAHTKGIIHRDIKPSNVLVTVADDKPIPKVIDFGIAKATHTRLTDRTLFTALRQLIGTPQYMSPEQADSDGTDVDTRTDVYSLGVLLYELLVGTTPFDARTLGSVAQDAMRKIIREQEPVKPSTKLDSLGDTLVSVASNRNTNPKRLEQTVRGELDWIVMRALEKDRTRRYDTAGALADDLERHLEGDPVAAGPPSGMYRIQKFARRHTALIGTMSAVAVALLLGVIGTSIGLVREAHQHREADRLAKLADEKRVEADLRRADADEQRVVAETQRAAAVTAQHEQEKQTAVAKAVSDFQLHMLTAADPVNLYGDKLTVLQAVTAAGDHLEDASGPLVKQPAVRAALHHAIGQTLHALGRLDLAELHLRKALELRKELSRAPGTDSVLAAAIQDLAMLRCDRGDPEEGEKLFRQSLEIHRRIKPGSAEYAADLMYIALILSGNGKHDSAESMGREALALELTTNGDVATARSNLGSILRTNGKLDEAESLYRQAVDGYRHNFPAGHPRIALGLSHLAACLCDEKKPAEAEPLLREALDIDRKVLPPNHPRTVSALLTLSRCLLDQSKTDASKADQADAVFIEWVESARKANPPDPKGLASALSARGIARAGPDSPTHAAIADLQESLAIRKEQNESKSPAARKTATALAALLDRTDPPAAAALRGEYGMKPATLP